MSDMFGGAPPAPPPAPRRRKAAAARPASSPAAQPQAMQVVQAEPPTPVPEKINIVGRQYGLVTLHDGRQVDSGSAEWRMECLASTLLQLGAAEREAWILGYGTEAARVELRLRIQAVKAARR